MTRRAQLRARPTIADMARAFGPLDRPLAQLAQGFVAADGETGAPVTQNIGGRWIELAPALEGLSIAWRRVLAHYRIEIDVTPLDRLAAALARSEEIPQALVAECQFVVVALNRAFRQMDAHKVKSLSNTASIEILMDEAQRKESSMSEMVEVFGEIKDHKKRLRAKFGAPCPECVRLLPKASPSILLPQQVCRIHKYCDPRPELTEEQWSQA